MSVFAKRFLAGRWSFLGPGSETKVVFHTERRPGGKWDRVAELMMITFGQSGHPVFRATSPFSRGMLKSNVDRNTSHVNFVMHLAHVITLTSWLKVSQVRSHSIHMSSMMSQV